jgi:hypothetical protein
MLDTWERASIDEVIERVEGEGGDARARLRRVFGLARTYSSHWLGEDRPGSPRLARREQTVAGHQQRSRTGRRTSPARRQPAMDYMNSPFRAFCAATS